MNKCIHEVFTKCAKKQFLDTSMILRVYVLFVFKTKNTVLL